MIISAGWRSFGNVLAFVVQVGEQISDFLLRQPIKQTVGHRRLTDVLLLHNFALFKTNPFSGRQYQRRTAVAIFNFKSVRQKTAIVLRQRVFARLWFRNNFGRLNDQFQSTRLENRLAMVVQIRAHLQNRWHQSGDTSRNQLS